MQTESVREKLFTIRMSDEERERAEAIAKHYGLNVAGMIRMILKREADAVLDLRINKATRRQHAQAKETKPRKR